MSSPPTGTLTFLFTDIAGSTQLWDTQHAAMKQAHARQADLITDSVTAHNGHLVRDRGEGDSTFSVFRSPADALAAACALQRALIAEMWPTDTPIRVRAALHVGPAELREGDYNSTAVNRCARLRSLAVGGQTLVSQAITLMTERLLPEGVMLRSLGSHRLKDLERPEEIFQLCHPELPDDFPPLRSLNSLPTNLPQQLNRFIGREAEVAQLTELLRTHDLESMPPPAHLLTLLGTGGAGKTRLSLQVGAEVLEAYPDGVWLVELASLTEPSLLPQTVATTLGVRAERNRPLIEMLIEHTRSRTLLLLLDNCEHLVEACARFAEAMLRACPQVKILATSREALNIAGEQVHRVSSLSLPDLKQALTAEKVTQYEAPRLFLERAAQVKADFTVTDETAPMLALLCHRLDGIPLAIELAAVRIRSLSIKDIHNRLDQRFRLLTGGSRTALPRQQTLHALIDWSYDLLSGSERIVLARLSVFSGGWTLAAAEVVCADEKIEEWEVLDLLSSLVDKSLALAVENQGTIRYRMLETISQYGAEKLRAGGEEAAVRRRHRDFYLAFALEAQVKLAGPEQASWLERLETEHDNLRQALVFCLEAPGEAVVGLRLAGALQQFWAIHSHLSEAQVRLTALLAHPDAQARTQVRALALNGAGILAYGQNEYLDAQALFEASLEIRKELQDTVGVARSLNNLGLIARELGDTARMQSLYGESLATFRELGDKVGIAASLYNLGLIAHDQCDYSLARSLYEESLAIQRELGDKHGIATALNGWGRVARDQGEDILARALYDEALTLWRELGDRKGIGNALNNLAGVASAQGDHTQAQALNRESMTIRQELGDRAGIAMSYNNLGNCARALGDYGEARTLYAQSIVLKRELGDQKGIATSLRGLGNVARDQGDPVLARSLYQESMEIQHAWEDRAGLVDTLDSLAHLCLEQGAFLRAAQFWGVSERLCEEFGIIPALSSRTQHIGNIARARQASDDSAFLTAWAAGKALPLEEALNLAHAEIESL